MSQLDTASSSSDNPQLIALRDRHRDFYVAFVEDARAAAEAAGPSARTEWAEFVEAELGNLRTAYEWALGGAHPAALALPAGLAWFWVDRRRLTEGVAWLRRALASAAPDDPEREAALDALAYMALHTGDYATAAEAARGRVELLRQRGLEDELLGALLRLGNAEHMARRLDAAAEALEEARSLGPDVGTGNLAVHATAVRILGVVVFELGDAERGVALHEEALEILRRSGDTGALAQHLSAHGHLLTRLGRPEDADPLFAEAADLQRRLGRDDLLVQVIYNRAYAAAAAERHDDAARYAAEATELSRTAGDPSFLAAALHLSARAAMAAGDRVRCAALVAEGIAALRSQPELSAMDRNALAALLQMQAAHAEDLGDVEAAEAAYSEAVEVAAALPGWAWQAPSILALARFRADHGDVAGARRELERASVSLPADPSDLMTLWMETEHALLVGDFARALSSARRWVDAVPADAGRKPSLQPRLRLARIQVLIGDLGAAIIAVDEAISVAWREADRLLAHLVRAEVRVLRGEVGAAASDIREVARRVRFLVRTQDHVRVAEILAAVASAGGRHEDARRLVAASDAARRLLRTPRGPDAVAIMATIAVKAGDAPTTVELDEFRRLVREELEPPGSQSPPAR